MSLTLLGAASCSEPLAPRAASGMYDLVLVNGTSPPVAVVTQPCAIAFSWGVLVLYDSTVNVQLDEEHDCYIGAAGREIDRVGYGGALEYVGSELRLRGRRFPGDSVLARLTVAGNFLVLHLADSASGVGAPVTLAFGPRHDPPVAVHGELLPGGR